MLIFIVMGGIFPASVVSNEIGKIFVCGADSLTRFAVRRQMVRGEDGYVGGGSAAILWRWYSPWSLLLQTLPLCEPDLLICREGDIQRRRGAGTGVLVWQGCRRGLRGSR